MKTLISTLVLLALIPLAFSTSLETPQTLENGHANHIITKTRVKITNSNKIQTEESALLRRRGLTINHLLAIGKTRLPSVTMTCENKPSICWRKSSGGSHCCKRQCVDISTNRLNCGICGNKCKFSEKCCKGKCVNPNSDDRNCGRCDNRCKIGNSCTHGMCNYAS